MHAEKLPGAMCVLIDGESGFGKKPLSAAARCSATWPRFIRHSSLEAKCKSGRPPRGMAPCCALVVPRPRRQCGISPAAMGEGRALAHDLMGRAHRLYRQAFPEGSRRLARPELGDDQLTSSIEHESRQALCTQALALYDRAVQLDPRWSVAHYGRGVLLQQTRPIRTNPWPQSSNPSFWHQIAAGLMCANWPRARGSISTISSATESDPLEELEASRGMIPPTMCRKSLSPCGHRGFRCPLELRIAMRRIPAWAATGYR